MNTFGKARPWIVIGAIAGALLLVQQFWYWEVERVDVKKDTYLVKVHRWGKELPEDEIVAPEYADKGVVLAVEQEGRHFLNPLFWSYEIHPIVKVPPGKALILTASSANAPNGRRWPRRVLSLAGLQALDGDRGILRASGTGRLPAQSYAFSWQEVAAIEIGPARWWLHAQGGQDTHPAGFSRPPALRGAGRLPGRAADAREHAPTSART